MTPDEFRKEVETNFPSVEFCYDGLTAQTYPLHIKNLEISYFYKEQSFVCAEGDEPQYVVVEDGWCFESSQSSCIGYGKTLADAVADSATRHQSWLDQAFSLEPLV